MDSLKGPAFCSRVICSLAQLKTWASHSPCPLIEHHADCFPQRPAQSEIKQKRPSLPSQQIHIIPNQSPPLLSLKQTVARPSHECSAGFPKFPPVHVLSNWLKRGRAPSGVREQHWSSPSPPSPIPSEPISRQTAAQLPHGTTCWAHDYFWPQRPVKGQLQLAPFNPHPSSEYFNTGDVSRFSPQFDQIFPEEELTPFFWWSRCRKSGSFFHALALWFSTMNKFTYCNTQLQVTLDPYLKPKPNPQSSTLTPGLNPTSNWALDPKAQLRKYCFTGALGKIQSIREENQVGSQLWWPSCFLCMIFVSLCLLYQMYLPNQRCSKPAC